MDTYKKNVLVSILIVLLGFLIPQQVQMPVENATNSDFNPNTFWHYPWGKSIMHKGVDIFAKAGTNVYSSTRGLVIYSGHQKIGGNIVLILGPKWRIHYYAHLNTVNVSSFKIVGKNKIIGSVGSTGNAIGKPSHLHYSIVTLFPYPWKIDDSKQGWKKMFYLNPVTYLKQQ